MARIAQRCQQLAESRPFQITILAVILANAVAIGLKTYPAIADRWPGALRVIDLVFLVVFTVEIVIRILAHGSRPWTFFRGGWNVFDFTIVALALLPLLGANATLARLVRVLRVIRLVEAIDELRVIVLGLARSLMSLAGVAVFVTLVIYVYAVTGTALYGTELPDDWGNVGLAMRSCFQVLTLSNWDVIYGDAREITPWATPFFVSYIVIVTLLVLNIVIAVVVSSVEATRQSELRREAELMSTRAVEEAPELVERIVAMRVALDELEQHLVEVSRADRAEGPVGGADQAPMA